MAGDPIKIQLNAEADTAAIEKTADALGEVDDGLKKLDQSGTTAERALDKTAKSTGDLDDAAQDAARRIDRDLTKALKDVGDEAQKAGRKLGDEVTDGTKRAGEGLDDFKDEALSSGREAAASFSGEFDDIADLVQETAANAFAGFGPIGATAGLAAAVGFGTLVTSIQERAEKAKAAVADMYADFKASGAAALSEGFIQSEIDKIVTDSDGVISFAEAQKYAATTGVELATVLRAMAGDAEAWNAVQEATASKQDAVAGSFGRTDEIMQQTGESYETVRQRLLDEQTALEEVDARLSENVKNREKATAAADAARSTVQSSAQSARDAADAELAYRDAVDASAKAIKDSQGNLTSSRRALLDATSAALDYSDALRDNGTDSETVADAQRAMYSNLVDLAKQAGYTESDARALVNTFVDFPDKIETGVVLEADEAKRQLDEIQRGTYTVRVKTVLDDPNLLFNQIRSSLSGRSVGVNVTPRAGRPRVS